MPLNVRRCLQIASIATSVRYATSTSVALRATRVRFGLLRTHPGPDLPNPSLKSSWQSIHMNRTGKRNQIIGITSTYHDEGKSTIAASLALRIAQTGAKVILVDCNFRHPSLSDRLGSSCRIWRFGCRVGSGCLARNNLVLIRQHSWPFYRSAITPGRPT